MVAKGNGFLKKYKGRGVGKSLSGKQFKNVWAELGQAGRSIRTFSKITAGNPMVRASHCDEIYCGLLRIWHIKKLNLECFPGALQ